MSTRHENTVLRDIARGVVFLGGLAVTAMSMASGFIWASQSKVVLVYVAGFLSWTGYLVAHYGVTGVFVDDANGPEQKGTADKAESGHQDSGAAADTNWSLLGVLTQLRAIAPANPVRAVGFVAGIGILVVGIAVLAWYVRHENHLLGNIGSGMFLGGYVLAHYFDTGKPL
ncbi:hypothetical protein ACFQJ7_08335 [Halovenus rubra]|uniref:Uncharacterized protein n=2 Tax=Halovenus rubra TaxID=869890 RepID=A0ABD5X7Y7_9EURY|nr:hypothetical protein [Halovenus rubra]